MGSRKGLLPDSIKPIPEPMLSSYHMDFVTLTCDQFHRKCTRHLMCKISLKNTLVKLLPHLSRTNELTHWGQVTHICVGKLTISGSDNGLSPGRRQAIIWTNAGILLIWHSGTNFSEIWIEIYTFSFKKMHLKMSSGKWRPLCFGLNVLMRKKWRLSLGEWSKIQIQNTPNNSTHWHLDKT